MEKIAQNEWAKDNIPQHLQMACRACGKIVHRFWTGKFKEFVHKGLCGPCLSKELNEGVRNR